jgi:hypothetical protein
MGDKDIGLITSDDLLRFISMAHYSVMCLTTTALRSRWTASRLKDNDLSLIAVGFAKECPDLG